MSKIGTISKASLVCEVFMVAVPVSAWYCPAGQAWQGSRPLAEMEPGAQPSLQSDIDRAPVSTVVRPSGQAWHEVDPG